MHRLLTLIILVTLGASLVGRPPASAASPTEPPLAQTTPTPVVEREPNDSIDPVDQANPMTIARGQIQIH